MAIITNGLYPSGIDSPAFCYSQLISDSYKKSDKYKSDKYIQDIEGNMMCFGIEMIKKTLMKRDQELYQKAKYKILDAFNIVHVDNKPFFIDSGGYSIAKGDVPFNYVDYLIKYYLEFINFTLSDDKYKDMYYMFLDILPSNIITKEMSINKMNEFLNRLLDVLDTQEKRNKMYIVLQFNSEYVYNTFFEFIKKSKIHEKIGSHKYAAGGMVLLDFNQTKYVVRPYMIALFDVLDLELNNLKNNIPVYFHILGTSCIYEMILVSWLDIYCKYYNIPLVITFDSTAFISNAVRGGTAHFINDFKDPLDIHPITKIRLKNKYLNMPLLHRPSNYTNLDYLNKIKEMIETNLDLEYKGDDWYDNKGRFTTSGNYGVLVNEYWSLGKIYEWIKSKCLEYKEWIINSNLHYNLKYLINNIMIEINEDFSFNGGRKNFDSNIAARLIQSLEWFNLAINNKLPKSYKSFELVKKMFYETNDKYKANNIIKFNSKDII